MLHLYKFYSKQPSIISPFSQPTKLLSSTILHPKLFKALNNGGIRCSDDNFFAYGVVLRNSLAAACIPSLLLGNDAVIATETGSGKTHGYLVPLVDKLLHTRSVSGIGASAPLSRKWCSNFPVTKSISSRSSSSVFPRFGATQCYSSKRRSPRKQKSKPNVATKDIKDAYFVVRKGNIVSVYKSFSECQAQVGSSISDHPVTVYKGYSLPKDAEEYLASCGLRNALYTINASDLKVDLFGTLVPCPFQEPAFSKGDTSREDLPQKRLHNVLRVRPGNVQICVLQFHAFSKGNLEPAGAGAVLRTLNGRLICRIRQGLGLATYHVAEYRAFILGLKKALKMGYTRIQAQSDNEHVCMQLKGLMKAKKLRDLYTEAKKLMDQCSSIQISLVSKENNSDADKQAKLAVPLADGQVQEDFS